MSSVLRDGVDQSFPYLCAGLPARGSHRTVRVLQRGHPVGRFVESVMSTRKTATGKARPSPAAGEAGSVGEKVLVSCPAQLAWLQSGQRGVLTQATQGIVFWERAEGGGHRFSCLTQECRHVVLPPQEDLVPK